jgi:pimeloyl-ACP methyl ester carboxylesterase
MKDSNFKRLARSLILVIVIGLSAACASATPTDSQVQPPAIPLEPCQLSAPGSSARLPAKCGTLTVYEDRAAQTGRQIDLRIAVLPAVSRSPAPDPLFFLTGGPGQAATESFLQIGAAFNKINQNRDIVLVDQRGTGQSHPLACPELPDESLSEFGDEQLTAWLDDCLTQLDADPRFYTTSIAMDDLDQVREALGYEAINIYGVSYGTRAALTYLQQHGDHVRAVILDGVVPQDEALGLDVARDAQRALDLIFTRCESDPACREAYPNLRAEFDSILTTLDTEPVKLALPHPISGGSTELTLTRDTAAVSIRLLSYTPETVALLPLLIHQAAEGNYNLLAAQALMVDDELSASITEGMAYSVQCAEDAPFINAAEAEQANAGTYLADSMTDGIAQICATWPRGDIPSDFKQPVVSDAPVLLLSGEADPVTPPANADQAAQTLSNSLHLVAPGQGHSVIYRGCIPRIATDFIESGSLANLQTDCVNDIAPMPFFVNFSGPQP